MQQCEKPAAASRLHATWSQTGRAMVSDARSASLFTVDVGVGVLDGG